MPKSNTRRKKVPSSLRRVIATNVTNRAAVVFPNSSNIPMAIRRASAVAESEGIAKSHVQNILAGVTSVTLEQLDALARALDLVAPYQLLIPDLDPRNPQVARGATHEEQEMYKKIAREAVKEALSRTTPPRHKK